jgi:hypothetical protein
MSVSQTVEVPENRRLIIDVPREVPAGPVILTFTPLVENEEIEYTVLSNERAASMTAEVIEKYRPALEELAK